MELRPLRRKDIESCVEVFYAADEELTQRLGLPVMPRNPASVHKIFEHVSGTTPGRAWVAEEEGRVIGFGMAADRDDLVFLSFLFVDPRYQSAGVGKMLYERCMPRDGFRGTCIWSVQPISGALYARDGLVPRTPLYTFIGRPREPLPVLPGSMGLFPVDQHDIDAIDREVLGFTRPIDHSAWRTWERKPFGVCEGSSVVGYGYVQQAGRIGPVACLRARDVLPAIGSLMTKVQPPEDWMVHVPGVAADTFVALLNSGMRLDGPPVLYCATEARIDHSRYVPATFALP